MLRHKNIDRICCVVLACTLLLTCGFMGAAASGWIDGERSMGYEKRLFDQSRVHTLDIVMDDWDAFLDTCTGEEYSVCTAVIDGESFGSVGIRGKGNTSLSSVAAYGNDRYSFKIEFDHYQAGKTYHGLDKLSLNNLIQDKTYMKDYLAYTLMNRMGVAAPLCSFVQINVNGEPWGLYLAVEGVEDSFLSRNYGADAGELYKPDSMSFGGGRGNGRDFNMEAFGEKLQEMKLEPPENVDPAGMKGFGEFSPENGMRNGGMNPGRGVMGSSDVMLQYTDDDPESYSNIFDSAKTEISDEDKQRLIASLKALSEGENIESVVDTEAVIRYLVVHNFLCNDDSYTGTMIHNYYLYEENGALSMIPWDYNLAFGAFGMGGMGSGATSAVNSPIDSPVSSGDIGSRPILSWIFESEEYLARYHEVYSQFVESVFASGWLTEEISRVREMIAPYVEAETRAFFTYDQFQTAVTELTEFCELRGQSIAGQLDGSIPSTTETQRADASALIDASGVDLTAMGEFNMGGKGGMDFGNRGGRGQQSEEEIADGEASAAAMVPGMNPFGGMQPGMALQMPGGQMGMPGMTPMEAMQPGQPMPGMAQQTPMEAMQAPGEAENVPQPGQAMDEVPAEGMTEADGGIQPQEDRQPFEDAGRQPVRLFGGSVLLLLAAILFAMFYRVNR
ncbi:MAG: CotH kinase family protein [Clostridia bacterium]|nr:CotH kinase family protein [Clostridia bacterium]